MSADAALTRPAPPRPTAAEVEAELATHVIALAGPEAVPRPEQLAAVLAVAVEGRRTLLVARTGFGKSAVYFSLTRMLRDRGWGPTVVVSPLLALMRDQVAAATRLGLRAETINSSNLDDWHAIEAAITADEVDLLLVSPERLGNQGFRDRVFRLLLDQHLALVCDEAHCISDWGHDFRPDYLRLRRVLDQLPATTPVLATTATANARVTADVATQLGNDALVLRTTLDRASLHLSVVELDSEAERLAWLAEVLPELPGSGIVYCLTVAQAEATAAWLTHRGVAATAYTGQTDTADREGLEAALRTNECKALVATSALGMGFDKGDLAFCVHLGLPPTPVAYYQQIGRAGRALDRAEVIALPRPEEDAAIWRWFEQVSLPPEATCRQVLDILDHDRATSTPVLETSVNLGRNRLATLLKILEVDGAVVRSADGWRLGDPGWRYDTDKAERLRRLRADEADQMRRFVALGTDADTDTDESPGGDCRLAYLRRCLDDEEATPCGRCDRCAGARWQRTPDPALVDEAGRRLRGGDIEIEPRKQWPSGLDAPKGRLAADRRAQQGRALCRSGDGGWGPAVAALLDDTDTLDTDTLDTDTLEQVLEGVAGVLRRWDWPDRPTWVCPVPSRRRGAAIDAVAEAIGRIGHLSVHHALVRTDGDTAAPGTHQADQANSAHQVANVWGRLAVDPAALPVGPVLEGPVLVVDDEVASRWTFTVTAWLLTGANTGPVLPFALRSR